MSRSLREAFSRLYRNLGGWSTNRRLLVIESDDWGSIRMPSKQVYESCLKAGYPVDQTFFERYDSLLSEHDLELLFNLLGSHCDSRGRHPVITANVVMTNPDFDQIRRNEFLQYKFEPIEQTFTSYPKHARCLSLWRQGLERGVFHPQFHGREHLNVELFMSAVRANDEVARFAFDNRMPGCIPKGPKALGNRFVETTRFRSAAEKDQVLAAQIEGLKMFEATFGFRSRTMIPTNYVWSKDFDLAVASMGVEAFQGGFTLKEQNVDGASTLSRRRIGARNEHNQFYLTRNAQFEPSLSHRPRLDSADRCLSEISVAFQMKKPAVISCHRINFCGFIDESNRDQNLHALNYLLESILKRWPDVEFITSTDLLDLVKQQP
jgi:hypothetical protein